MSDEERPSLTHLHTAADPRVFVFGSNLKGWHGGGAANYARLELGAIWGIAEGLMPSRRCYGLPTCSGPGRKLSLPQVKYFVDKFLAFAYDNPNLTFFVSDVGCGLAGFTADEIRPLFAGAPDNCDLPIGWRERYEAPLR